MERDYLSGAMAHMARESTAVSTRAAESQQREHAGLGSLRRAIVEDQAVRDARLRERAAAKGRQQLDMLLRATYGEK